mmetsp:Transcript_25957/g.52918  ORF Transcript_25957/g.52918 Transcript_25957/m.52918 type:complete len:81 (+) Transcript_25957:1042-1284(+)
MRSLQATRSSSSEPPPGGAAAGVALRREEACLFVAKRQALRRHGECGASAWRVWRFGVRSEGGCFFGKRHVWRLPKRRMT